MTPAELNQKAIQLITKRSGKITVHAEMTGYSSEAWAGYGFRAAGFNTLGMDFRRVAGQKNVLHIAPDFISFATTDREIREQRLFEISSYACYRGDWDHFWEMQGDEMSDKARIREQWEKSQPIT